MSNSNALLIAPPPNHPQSHTQTTHSAPSAPGIHDTLRASQSNPLTSTTPGLPTDPSQSSSHPLSHRLATFSTTAQSTNHALLKRNYGLSAPLIREMELGIVRGGDGLMSRELCMGPGMGVGSVNGGGGRSVHEDVLLGRDCEIGWEDVFGGGDLFAPMPDFHTYMERGMGMDW